MRVRYEDEAIVVVDKPFGLPSQAPRGGGANLFDQVRAIWPKAALLHRLDTVASGLVLFAIDPRVNAALTEAFRSHAVHRTYRAVVVGTGLGAEVWDVEVQGKAARTQVESLGTGRGCTAVRLLPHTGRKHQLRIHAAMAGFPMCGDRRYGGEAARRWPRLALHASRLGFVHPVSAEPTTVESPLPDDLVELWQSVMGS
ncbi:MAG: RluA family pseudouridine synthase [Myxococcota bacterium]